MSEHKQYFIDEIISMTKGGKVTITPVKINVATVNPFGEYQCTSLVATSIDGSLVYGTNIDGQTIDVELAKLPTSVLVRLLRASR